MDNGTRKRHQLVQWIVEGRSRSVGVVTAGIQALHETGVISRPDSLRLQLAVEGVFGYCAEAIKKGGKAFPVTVEFYRVGAGFEVVINHHGPGGCWDVQLHAREYAEIRRTSFESLGLYLAIRLLADLRYHNYADVVSGASVQEYTLAYVPAD